MEEAEVEGLEDLVEVVMVAFGGGDALAAAGLADVFGLARNGLGGDVAAIAVGLAWDGAVRWGAGARSEPAAT